MSKHGYFYLAPEKQQLSVLYKAPQPQTDASSVPVEIARGLDPAVADVLADWSKVSDRRQQRNDSLTHELSRTIEHVLTAEDRSWRRSVAATSWQSSVLH